MSDAHDLTALHKAATPAPWSMNDPEVRECNVLGFVGANRESCIYGPEQQDSVTSGDADAALIVALRNAYASGDLVPREKVEELEARIATAESALEIQGGNGNWNYGPYMHGMYNGMDYVLALVRGREFEYREAPDQWLCDAAREDTSLCEKVEELERVLDALLVEHDKRVLADTHRGDRSAVATSMHAFDLADLTVREWRRKKDAARAAVKEKS